MTERPLLFSAPMVRAILAGTKTQTRRLVKPQPRAELRDGYSWQPDERTGEWASYNGTPGERGVQRAAYSLGRCPYGVPGERLWVREKYCWPAHTEAERKHVVYAADWTDAGLSASDVVRRKYPELARSYPESRWRPSIHMPRNCSRITLRVISVRVERLQEINEDDAKAEGAAFVCDKCGNDLDTDEGNEVHFACDDPDDAGDADFGIPPPGHRVGFKRLWDSINADRAPWSSNPWVWVIGFERIKP